MNIIFVDDREHGQLLPLTFTRPAADLRIGILTIREKWEKLLKPETVSYWTKDYLKGKYPAKFTGDNLLINGTICPDENLLKAISNLEKGESLESEGVIIAQRTDTESEGFEKVYKVIPYNDQLAHIDKPWKIFSLNAAELEKDFDMVSRGRISQKLSSTNTVIGDRIFVEEGIEAECAVFNTKSGAIYLGKDTTVMEGSVVRGALALCEHSTLKLGAKIYGATTIGPHSKVGGEVNNSVITGYSNKGHDGFLGNSVLGEWCNLGADTNNSNLKNNYDEVKLWSYNKKGFEGTGLQFCGLIMGDHSKCGINTMFNTGTVVGVSANIFGAGFPRNFVPSFSWGGAGGFSTYKLDKALHTAGLVVQRRGLEVSQEDANILEYIFENTAQYRQR